jgi:hypothetical protein
MSKSVQQFECRDDVWKRVVALAKRRGISTDEVVQAALVQLFKRKKGSAEKSAAAPAPEPAAAEPAAASAPAEPAPAPKAKPKPEPPRSSPPAAKPRNDPPRRSPPRPSGANRGLPKPGGRGLPKPGGRPAPEARRPAAAQPAEATPLYLFCEGQWYTIDQDQFVIGRGSKFSDLPIKDANISRRHAAVVRRNGEYFIKDLGSTNGIEFNGERVDDHLVNDGSVYYLCDHELRFSFTSPF